MSFLSKWIEKAPAVDLTEENALSTITLWTILGAIGGLTGIFLAPQFAASQRSRVIGLGLLLAGGSYISGLLIGLIFGVPKNFTNKGASNAYLAAEDSRARQFYSVNTNLADISDWLTKIIVGVGLTQFKEIQHFLLQFIAYTNRNGFNWPKRPHS